MFFDKLSRLVLGKRLLAGLVLFAVVFGLAGGCGRLKADFSLLAFFGSGDPEVEYLEAYKERWGPDDATLVIVVEAEEGTLITPSRLRRIAAIGEAIARDEDVSKVRSIANVSRLRSAEPGSIDLTPVIETMPPESDPQALEAWQAALRSDRIFKPLLLDESGRFGTILADLSVNVDHLEQIVPVVTRTRAILHENDGQDGLHFNTAGIPAIRADFFDLLVHDQTRILPVVFLICVLALALILRRVHGVVTPMFAAFVPVVMLFGLMGWTGEVVGLFNQNYMNLLPVIAIADAIHMVARFHEEARRRAPPGAALSPEARREAITEAMGKIGMACLLTSVTTAIGFASLYSARMPVLRNYGLYAAAGIAFAYASVVLVVPLLLSFSRGSVPEAGRREAPTVADRVLLWIAELSVRRSGLVLAASALVVAASAWFSTKTVVDNEVTALLYEEHETSKANAIAEDQLGGLVSVDVELTADPDTLRSPATLRALFGVEEWLKAQPQVRAVSSLAGYVADLHEIVEGTRTIPEGADAISQLLILAEGDDAISRMLTADGGKSRLIVRTRDDGGLAFDAFASRVADRLARDLAGTGVQHHVTGTAYVAYRGTNDVSLDLRNSLTTAFVMIALIIGALFRSVRVTLICLVPNALPLLCGYGLMGAIGWIIDPGPAVVFTLALGIAVDDTIHLMARYKEERVAGRAHLEAVRESLLHSGRAVATTSIVLAAGFLVSMLGSFPGMRVMAVLGAVIILTALLADLFLLPSLLVRFGGVAGAQMAERAAHE